MRRLFLLTLWAQAVLMVVLAGAVLIVPEIPLGRVVEPDLRWMIAAGWCVLGALAFLTARMQEADALRSLCVALAVGGVAHAAAGFFMPDAPQSAAHMAGGVVFSINALIGVIRPSDLLVSAP